MNKARRKRRKEMTNEARRKELERAIELMGEARDIIDDYKAEEEEYLENTPENLQYFSEYDIAVENIENIEEAIDKLEGAMQNVEDVME